MELYSITFPDGKLYLGISQNSRKRLSVHKANSRRGAPHLVNMAIRHFGEDHLKLKVLCIGDKDYICDLEIKAIEAYQTRDREFGYNMALGGQTSPVAGIGHTAESKAKMSRSRKGKALAPEHRAKINASLKNRIITEEHKQKLRDASKRRWAEGRGTSPEAQARGHAKLKGRVGNRLGRKASSETRAKIKAKRALQVCTDETRQKMSESAKRQWAERKARL